MIRCVRWVGSLGSPELGSQVVVTEEKKNKKRGCMMVKAQSYYENMRITLSPFEKWWGRACNRGFDGTPDKYRIKPQSWLKPSSAGVRARGLSVLPAPMAPSRKRVHRRMLGISTTPYRTSTPAYRVTTHTTAAMATLSSDLIWEVVKQQGSSTLVKRAQTGGVSFSRDPLNLRNQFSRKVRFYVLEDMTIG